MSRVRDIADNSAVFADGITSADITEGSNLFFTNTRADARITLKMIDEDNMSSDSAAHMPSQQSVKAYIDAQTLVLIDEDNMSTNSATRPPSQQSVKAFVDTSVAGLVDSAPGTLDTLNELAAALGDDANFSTTVTNSIATKLSLAGGTMTGDLVVTKNSAAIQVNESSGATTKLVAGGSLGYVGTYSNHSLQLLVNSTPKLVIDTNGDVGIGTTSPYAKQHIQISSNTGAGSGSSGAIWLKNANGGAGNAASIFWGDDVSSAMGAINFMHDDYSNNYGSIKFDTRGSSGYGTKMTITNAGNVGIGTDNPSANLHVKKVSSTAFSASGSSWHSIVVNNENTSATDRTAGIAFQLNGYHANAGTGIAAVKNGTASDYGASLVFITRPQAAVAEERMRIDAEGNVGIGTTTFLDQPMVIYQDESDAYTPTGYNDKQTLTLKSPNLQNNYTSIRFSNSVGNYEQMFGTVQSGSDSAEFVWQGYDRGAGTYKEWMRLSDDGSLGIIATNPQFKLHVNKGTSNYAPANGVDENIVGFQTSAYSDGGQILTFSNLDGNWIDGTSGADSAFGWLYGWQNNVRGGLVYDHRGSERMQLWSSYGALTLMTADSADADAVPTDSNMNERLTILPGGNVGIGTTSPHTLLHVKQTGNSGNNYDEGTVKVGGASSTLGFTMNYSSLGSGRANLTGLNTSGGTNNRISLGFGAIQSYGEPADRVLTVDQGHFVHHTPPGNARFMPMISPQSVTRHGAYPTHPAGDGIGSNQTNQTQLGFAHVYARNWTGRYIHMKTNIPCTGSNYGMVLVYAKGYRYSPGGTIDSSWGFHNWGGAIYSLDQRNYATTFAVNCYDSSDNYCVLVGDNQTTGASYTGFRLDFMYSNTNYGAHTETANGESHYLLGTSFSSSTSGVY